MSGTEWLGRRSDLNGTMRASLIYKDRNASGKVTVELRGLGARKLTQLLAAGYESKTGIKFGGQTLDGKLVAKFIQSGHPSLAVLL